MNYRIFLFCCFITNPLSSSAQQVTNDWLDYFSIENITIPNTIDPQIGGLEVLDDGRVAAAFHSGQVAIYSPKTNEWHIYAKGLHEPLGLLQDGKNGLLVMQAAELTRLIDENKDGTADFYQNVSNAFGISGNYHEFAFGPARDQKGNLYFSLNLASNYAGTFEKTRGDLHPLCLPKNIIGNWRKHNWKTLKDKVGRMFSCVPYRGWIMKVTPDGKTSKYASGVRSPDGLVIDNENRLWVTDNQGDWRGTSPMYLVEEGDFLGHPASLLWRNNWQTPVVDIPVEQLEKIRKPAAVLFPQGELANSPTKPEPTVSAALFGLPKGELLIGDMNQKNLIRFLPEKVNGFTQGALIPFLQTEALGIGNHRMQFDKEGHLWIGKTHLGWAGDEGLRKITWNKKPYLIVEKVKLTEQGFQISFNKAVSSLPNSIKITSHTYHYHSDYGSEKIDIQHWSPEKTTLDSSSKMLTINLPKIKEKRLYTLSLKGIKNKQGDTLMGDVIRYNVVKMR